MDGWEEAVVNWEAQRLGLKNNTVSLVNSVRTLFAAAQMRLPGDGSHSRLVQPW